MSFTVQVDAERGVGVVTLVGRITGMALAEAGFQLLEDPAWRPGYHEVWNGLSIEELVVDLEEMRRVAALEKGHQQALGSGKVAIVADREVVQMMGQLFKMMVAETGRSVQVFATLDTALAWLDLEAPRPAAHPTTPDAAGRAVL